ncbi:MAG: hypothetical protein HKN23_04385 [Verrucomicrobiales bacterium]|nr:hypothetical protein [Verrucomicrobiales bacterium]
MKQLSPLVAVISAIAFSLTSSAQEKPEASAKPASGNRQPTEKELAGWLKRFPEADTDKDGKLSLKEAFFYRRNVLGKRPQKGAPKKFNVDPGWDAESFPPHAVCYRKPQEIKSLYALPVPSYSKPTDGGLRIVGTGHSFMMPGYRTLPKICAAAGFEQPLFTHTGGGITGSARYKWEQENGIFQFDKNPKPKLLAAISNGKWDAMTWGPYYNDRPEFYSCWIEFCQETNPNMKFFLSDAWPQLSQLDEIPKSEDFFTPEVFDQIGAEKNAEYGKLIKQLRERHPGTEIYTMPTSDSMVLAAKHYLRGELPGVEGINRIIGKKERSLWKDQLGHLGPGFDRLEGYVFYATIYGRSPELIKSEINFGPNLRNFPSPELDRIFRKIAWQAVINNPLSGVVDENRDGMKDEVAVETTKPKTNG